MEKIRVNKQELLTIIKENRKKHKKEYIEAIQAYRVKAGDIFTKELAKIVSGENFNTRFELIKPESHIKEYDLAIKMLEMSVDDNVEIERHEFNQLVNDEWDWKYSFSTSRLSNQAYFNSKVISGTTLNSSDIEVKFSADEIDEE